MYKLNSVVFMFATLLAANAFAFQSGSTKYVTVQNHTTDKLIKIAVAYDTRQGTTVIKGWASMTPNTSLDLECGQLDYCYLSVFYEDFARDKHFYRIKSPIAKNFFVSDLSISFITLYYIDRSIGPAMQISYPNGGPEAISIPAKGSTWPKNRLMRQQTFYRVSNPGVQIFVD